jgi:hypothetical protein
LFHHLEWPYLFINIKYNPSIILLYRFNQPISPFFKQLPYKAKYKPLRTHYNGINSTYKSTYIGSLSNTPYIYKNTPIGLFKDPSGSIWADRVCDGYGALGRTSKAVKVLAYKGRVNLAIQPILLDLLRPIRCNRGSVSIGEKYTALFRLFVPRG